MGWAFCSWDGMVTEVVRLVAVTGWFRTSCVADVLCVVV